MGRETGGYRLRFLVVRAGKFVRKPLFKANSKVDRAGEKRVVSANATILHGGLQIQFLGTADQYATFRLRDGGHQIKL